MSKSVCEDFISSISSIHCVASPLISISPLLLILVLRRQDDEIGRLSSLLDEEGDGRVSYRSLLDLLLKRLGNWTKRLPEVSKGRRCLTVHHLPRC